MKLIKFMDKDGKIMFKENGFNFEQNKLVGFIEYEEGCLNEEFVSQEVQE